MRNFTTVLLTLSILSLFGAGCSDQPKPMPSVVKIEDKIKNLEKSDLPPQIKQKAIDELKAKQATGAK